MTSKKPSNSARATRIAVLLALVAVLLAVLWHVAEPRLFARDRGVTESTSAASLPDVQMTLSAEPAAALDGRTGAPAAAPAAHADAPPAPKAPALPTRTIERDRRLEERVRGIVASAEHSALTKTKGVVQPGEISVSVHVRELGAAGELVSIAAEKPMRPASNLKLVTSAAALVLLGRDARLETLFESDAPLASGTLQGDLVVHAGGDPLYDPTAEGDVDAFFAPAVHELRAAGIAHVAGAIVLDEGDFQDPAAAPGWPPEGQRWAEFCALAGGFSANAGCLTARVRPGAQGAEATVEVFPRGHGLPEKIDVRTGGARSKLDVRVGASGGTVRVEGSFPRDVENWHTRFAAPDPVLLFGRALVTALQRGGISVEGGVRRERLGVRAHARPLAKISTPILNLLVPINAHSNNACADQLFLALGHRAFGRGDRAGGRSATELALQRLGVPDDGFVQVDGSGLSREDRVSARQITALVAGVLQQDERTASAFFDSLAAPKEDGTLDARLEGLEGRVRAKTGFIGGTSALSGVLEAEGNRRLVFSILIEYPKFEGLNTSVWKPMEDDICRALAGVRG